MTRNAIANDSVVFKDLIQNKMKLKRHYVKKWILKNICKDSESLAVEDKNDNQISGKEQSLKEQKTHTGGGKKNNPNYRLINYAKLG